MTTPTARISRELSRIDQEDGPRKSIFFNMVDQDNSGTIDRAEFDKLYDDIKTEVQKEHERESKLESRVSRDRKRIRLLVILAVCLIGVVGLSVAVNAAVMFALLEATKETHVSMSGVMEMKGSNATIQVANSEMGVSSDGALVAKSGSPLTVASDALTVDQQTGAIKNKEGSVNLAVDKAVHQTNTAYLAKQLVSRSTL